jgi:hypothetical protein
MFPEKKWLSLNEACGFLDMSVNHLQSIINKNSLTVSAVGKKKYYRVSELESLIEQNIVIESSTI